MDSAVRAGGARGGPPKALAVAASRSARRSAMRSGPFAVPERPCWWCCSAHCESTAAQPSAMVTQWSSSDSRRRAPGSAATLSPPAPASAASAPASATGTAGSAAGAADSAADSAAGLAAPPRLSSRLPHCLHSFSTAASTAASTPLRTAFSSVASACVATCACVATGCRLDARPVAICAIRHTHRTCPSAAAPPSAAPTGRSARREPARIALTSQPRNGSLAASGLRPARCTATTAHAAQIAPSSRATSMNAGIPVAVASEPCERLLRSDSALTRLDLRARTSAPPAFCRRSGECGRAPSANSTLVLRCRRRPGECCAPSTRTAGPPHAADARAGREPGCEAAPATRTTSCPAGSPSSSSARRWKSSGSTRAASTASNPSSCVGRQKRSTHPSADAADARTAGLRRSSAARTSSGIAPPSETKPAHAAGDFRKEAPSTAIAQRRMSCAGRPISSITCASPSMRVCSASATGFCSRSASSMSISSSSSGTTSSMRSASASSAVGASSPSSDTSDMPCERALRSAPDTASAASAAASVAASTAAGGAPSFSPVRAAPSLACISAAAAATPPTSAAPTSAANCDRSRSRLMKSWKWPCSTRTSSATGSSPVPAPVTPSPIISVCANMARVAAQRLRTVRECGLARPPRSSGKMSASASWLSTRHASSQAPAAAISARSPPSSIPARIRATCARRRSTSRSLLIASYSSSSARSSDELRTRPPPISSGSRNSEKRRAPLRFQPISGVSRSRTMPKISPRRSSPEKASLTSSARPKTKISISKAHSCRSCSFLMPRPIDISLLF
ncbi:hypothetical protein T492DRAFT_1055761 [Pavlovales sp. CCMP2436]|nr:hypothetical protein T492DRAFT_1055761 [Pavlovales sp. CCMP2436]